ncbi:MAG: diadenylate cyclase CdaA [Clostridia bacterium]|nr:diadenylate cyclase CdaA [Clostridia bacterium]
MKENLFSSIENFWQVNAIGYFNELVTNPLRIVALIIDLTIVIFLIYKFIKITRKSRVWQLIKGIAILVAVTIISGWLHLDILHTILTSIMTYGAIVLMIIFQPELRKGLEQLGTNKFTKLFGIDKDLITKTKEDIYKIVIAAEELSSTKTGALIVIERDIKLQDIAETGVPIDSEVSPQLLVNIFVPNTPLHDGAVIISNNRVSAAACILPLTDDKTISKKLGTRHRAALGVSKETDSIAIVVSEETGKISVAKDGTLIVDVDEETLKRLLIKNVIKNRLEEKNKKNKNDKKEKNKVEKKEETEAKN